MCRGVGAAGAAPLQYGRGLHKNAWISFAQLFLCLSRACLGKMMISSIETLQKGAFPAPFPSGAYVALPI